MSTPASRLRANAKYALKAYDRLYIVVRKGRKAELEQAAEATGESLNGLINRIIDEYLERNRQG